MENTITYDSKELIDNFVKAKIGISVLIKMYTTFFKENEELLSSYLVLEQIFVLFLHVETVYILLWLQEI